MCPQAFSESEGEASEEAEGWEGDGDGDFMEEEEEEEEEMEAEMEADVEDEEMEAVVCGRRAGAYRDSYSYRWSQRYMGHDNRNTDIKEAVFMGQRSEYIVGGSDCGHAFIWNRRTATVLRALKADEDVVNCCQPHPHQLLLATSGIEDVIRLWRPSGAKGLQRLRHMQSAGAALVGGGEGGSRACGRRRGRAEVEEERREYDDEFTIGPHEPALARLIERNHIRAQDGW